MKQISTGQRIYFGTWFFIDHFATWDERYPHDLVLQIDKWTTPHTRKPHDKRTSHTGSRRAASLL